jgi:putative intracellular protease/amidase
MQLGHILQHLSDCGEQYVFIGNPLPFNGGWHFTAVNDFEHPKEQMLLSPEWKNIRIWHRVNYVPTLTEAGEAAFTPRESYNPEKKDGAIPISESRKFASIFLIGGLMPHTLNATLLEGSNPGALFVSKHLELGANFATIGHGLDVLIALGSREKSAIEKFSAAVFPGQDHLLRINGVEAGTGTTDGSGKTVVCKYKYKEGSDAGYLLSASFWGKATKDVFLDSLSFAKDMAAADPPGPERLHVMSTTEPILCLDVSKLPNINGAAFAGDPSAPSVAIFVDDVADTIEAYGMVEHMMSLKWNFHMVSHSWPKSAAEDEKVEIRKVSTETVFGNAMYGLKDCMCVIPTIPANLIPSGTKFDGFFVAGGQCPYMMMNDESVTAIMDACPVAAAVCHGPEALIGSKWLHGPDGPGSFISYYGAWMSFRDVIGKYERKKPGEICQDASGRLFTGNAPNATKPMVVAACSAIKAMKENA